MIEIKIVSYRYVLSKYLNTRQWIHLVISFLGEPCPTVAVQVEPLFSQWVLGSLRLGQINGNIQISLDSTF